MDLKKDGQISRSGKEDRDKDTSGVCCDDETSNCRYVIW